MDISSWTPFERWRYAIKPASWPKLLVPMSLGICLGSVSAGRWPTWVELAVAVAFTIFDGLFIVLLNDWGDREVDRIKREMFPEGCSPKTIPDGILPARQVLAAGVMSGLAALAVAALGGWLLDLTMLPVVGVVCLAFFVAYTLPPIALNYRGGGELLEMLGVGVALPCFGAFAVGGELADPVMLYLVGFSALSLASALASGLSDEESDRAGGKRTFATVFGNKNVRRATLISAWSGVALLAAAALVQSSWVHLASALVASSGAAYFLVRTGARSAEAVTGAFRAQKVYKQLLHYAIWFGGGVLGFLLLIDHVR